MSDDVPPDRLAANPKSPFHDAALLERGVGIKFNGNEKTNVEEYCVSEGWVRVAAGKSLDRFRPTHDDQTQRRRRTLFRHPK